MAYRGWYVRQAVNVEPGLRLQTSAADVVECLLTAPEVRLGVMQSEIHGAGFPVTCGGNPDLRGAAL